MKDNLGGSCKLIVYKVPNNIPLEATSCLLLQGAKLCSVGGCQGQFSYVYILL